MSPPLDTTHTPPAIIRPAPDTSAVSAAVGKVFRGMRQVFTFKRPTRHPDVQLEAAIRGPCLNDLHNMAKSGAQTWAVLTRWKTQPGPLPPRPPQQPGVHLVG